MPFKEIDPAELASKLGINYVDVLEKQKLIAQITEMRQDIHLLKAQKSLEQLLPWQHLNTSIQ